MTSVYGHVEDLRPGTRRGGGVPRQRVDVRQRRRGDTGGHLAAGGLAELAGAGVLRLRDDLLGEGRGRRSVREEHRGHDFRYGDLWELWQPKCYALSAIE